MSAVRYLADYHTHSRISPDARHPMTEMARAAAEAGLDEICFTDESHWNGLLEYPQYSRPDEWHGLTVPEVLRSGDHAKVARWQKKQAILRTLHRRPDLFYKLRFPYKTRAERKFIAELEAEDDAFRDRNPKNLDYRK